MAYDPVADNKQYVLTNMLDNIEGGASNTMKFLNVLYEALCSPYEVKYRI